MCVVAEWLHISGPKAQAVAAVAAGALAGTDADRQAQMPNGGLAKTPLENAFFDDSNDVPTWQSTQYGAAQQMATVLQHLMEPPSGVDPKYQNSQTAWTTPPDYNAAENTFLVNRQDQTFHNHYVDPVVPADQAALNKVTALAAASTDPVMAGIHGVRDLIGNPDFGDYSTDAADVAAFLTDGGFAQTAPPAGSVEFRTDVETIKTRFAGCTSENPWDPHDVLKDEVTTAATEWQAELDAVAPQREAIVAASDAADVDLQKASDAMANIMGQAWVGQRLLEVQRYQANCPTIPATDPAYGWWCGPQIQTVSNEIAASDTYISTQLSAARAAAADAQTQANAIGAAQATAATTEQANGTPIGRGLFYAQQAAQSGKAAAAAAAAAKASSELSGATNLDQASDTAVATARDKSAAALTAEQNVDTARHDLARAIAAKNDADTKSAAAAASAAQGTAPCAAGP